MGLFKSSPKTPPPPAPTLSVWINNPENKVFKPNDTVTGQVTFTTPGPIRPQAIEVLFWGMSSVWIRHSHNHNNSTTNSNTTSYTHYRDNAPLFEVRTNVLGQHSRLPGYEDVKNETRAIEKDMMKKNGKEMETGEPSSSTHHQQQQQTEEEGFLLPSQPYIYPFTFLVPEGTGMSRQGFYKSDFDERWTIHPHPLPPSMLHGQRKETPDNAFIEYGITARLLCPDLFPPPTPNTSLFKRTPAPPDPISDTTFIDFAPLNTLTNAPQTVLRYPKQNLSLSSSILSTPTSTPETPPQPLSLRQSLRDKFSKSTPKLTFEHAIELPDHLTSGTPFRFRTSYTTLSTTQNVVAIPPVTFQVLKLELLDFTFLRAPRDYKANTMMSGAHRDGSPTTMPQGAFEGLEDTRYVERKTVLNSVPGAQTVGLEERPVGVAVGVGEKEEEKGMEQVKSCEAWFEARVPGFTTPSFKGFAVSRCYRLKVKVGVVVGGKTFVHEVESVVNALGSAP